MSETASDILTAVTREQCRGARGLLGWSLEQLATRADVSRNTINKFENGQSKPHRATMRALRMTLEAAGIEFIENGKGPGVRLVKNVEA